MATIQSTIELYDSFSPVLYNVMDAMNLTIASVGQMQNALNADVDMASLDSAMDSIHQAGAAMAALNEQLANHSNTNINIATPEPVQVPVHWEVDNMEVFTNTGVERFRQEVQSANAMLNVLNQTQAQITATAGSMDILPPQSSIDMMDMQNRMQAIQQRIMEISNNPINMRTEQANAELERMRSVLARAIDEQNRLNAALNNMDVASANRAYLNLSSTVSNMEQYLRDNTTEQGRFNQQIRDGTTASNNLLNSVKKVAGAYLGVQGVQKVMNLSDSITSTNARLELLNEMNGSLQTQEELQNAIFASAERSRASYGATADTIAKLGIQASKAFSGTDEIIAFTELMNKNFVVGGSSATEQAAAMYQLTQAMSAGKLQGDEYRSIIENAPLLANAIEDYMVNVQQAEGSMKDWASEGMLTADVIKAALFSSADEINERFEQMPMTFEQVWTSIANRALMAFQPVLERLNDMANNEQFQAFVNGAIEAMAVLANVVLNVFDVMGSIAGVVIDNWSIIAPIILGVAAAIAVYTLFTKGAEIATKAAELATRVWTAVQGVFNAVMSMNPVGFVVIAIVLLIAIIYAVVAIINKVTGSSISAAGVICGAIATVGAILINTAIGAINAVLQFIWSLFVEPFIGIIEWILNVANGGFDSFGDAVANLIGNIISWFLSLGKVVTKIIDAIFGTNWTAGLTSLQNEVLAWGKNEDAITLDRSAWQVDYRMDYGDAWNAGYGFGEGIDNAISGFDLSDIFGATNIPTSDYTNAGAYGDSMANIADNTDATAGNTADIADALEITEEDLKYLRDIAEREVIDRTVLKSVTIDMSGMTNKVENMQDLDGISTYLAKSLRQQMEVSMEGA